VWHVKNVLAVEEEGENREQDVILLLLNKKKCVGMISAGIKY
jgi:hypothetical protein